MEAGQHNPAQGNESNGGPEIGRLLEQKRKERGLSLEEVEQATKIRKRYLTGLEREDYAMLPDAVYARGFLKTYANYLGLDGEAFSRRLKSTRKPRRERGINYNIRPEESDFEQPLMAPNGLSRTRKRRISTSALVTLLVALLALAAVIGTLYFVGRGVQASKDGNPTSGSPPRQEQQKVADRQKTPQAGLAKEDAAGSEGNAGDREKPAGAKQSVPPDTLQVLVNVRERPSWILIRADGNVAYEQIAQPGFSQTFEAERQLYIKCGDAGAVTVEINGQDIGPLGPAYEIVARNYTLKNAS
jgi:cytoskeleton protein RodZ